MAECARYQRVVKSTVQYDPTLQFVGGSPWPGDLSASGLVLPVAPTTSSELRYLVRLCGLRLGPYVRCVVRWVRQLLTIGTELPTEQGGAVIPVEQEVISPTWRFIDGNVSWHLRKLAVKRGTYIRQPSDVVAFPPYTALQEGQLSGILTRQVTPYIPLNGGIPPGEDIGGLGNMRDMRYPYANGVLPNDLNLEVVGPADVIFFASVWQTDPETRPNPPDPGNTSALRPEDRFVLQYPESRYWRIGAEMLLDVCNPEPR